MTPNIFNSISSKIVFLVSLVLVITATSIMYFSNRDVGKAMFDAQEASARNVLELVELNIRGGYNRLISDKIDILNRMKADLKNIGHISVSVIDEFRKLTNKPDVDDVAAKKRVLSWLSNINYEQINVFVFDGDGKIVGFSDSNNRFEDFGAVHDLKGRRLVEVMHNQVLSEQGDTAIFHWKDRNAQKTSKKMSYFIPVREWDWTLGVVIDFDNIDAESRKVLDNIIKLLDKTFSKIKIAETGYAFLFSGNGEILISPPGLEAAEFASVINSATGNLLTDDLKQAYKEKREFIRFPDPYSNNNEILEANVNYFKAFNWYFAAVVPVVEIQAPGKALLQRQMVVIGLIFLISTLFTFFFVSKISRPLKLLSDYAKELPKVDFTKESKASDQIARLPSKYTDEVGRLARSFVFMEQELKKNITAAIESTAAKERLEREAAEESSRAKGEFLANMSHEIRTPINGMLGMMELLTQTRLDSRQQDFVMTLRESGNSLLTIINNILDFSKIEASKMDLEEVEFSPGEILEASGVMFAEMAQVKGLELVCLPEIELFQKFTGDPSRLQQVITNLCGNSVKFTEHGHILLSADIIDQNQQQAIIKFVIKDTGIGLDKEAQKHIFDSFSQADSSTTRRYGGTGLGLSICKHLVELMGGEIGVMSQRGEGAAFWFTIALKPCKSTLPTKQQSDKELEVLPSNILIVTDSTILGYSLSKRISAEQVLIPTVISSREISGFTENRREPSKSFDIILFDSSTQKDLAVSEEILSRLREFTGSKSVRCGLLVTLRQKYSEGVLGMEKVDFAIAMPVPRVALQRMLSSDGLFWLDSNNDQRSFKSSDEAGIGAKILVAEDNPVNQKLITEVLKIFACESTLVENGRQAVLQAEKNQFDLILMDCQMPEMDGFQATDIIRAREREAGIEEGIRIIALTANARKEDREKCLSHGMNDYLSKPFTMNQLREIILKWYSSANRDPNNQSNLIPAVDIGIDSTEAPAVETLLDTETINSIRALQSPQSPDILEQLLEIYLSNAPELIKELNLSIQNQNFESIRNSAHSLKSSSGNIGARKIFELSATLEEKGRESELNGASSILEEIERLFPKVCELLENEIQRSAA